MLRAVYVDGPDAPFSAVEFLYVVSAIQLRTSPDTGTAVASVEFYPEMELMECRASKPKPTSSSPSPPEGFLNPAPTRGVFFGSMGVQPRLRIRRLNTLE